MDITKINELYRNGSITKYEASSLFITAISTLDAEIIASVAANVRCAPITDEAWKSASILCDYTGLVVVRAGIEALRQMGKVE